MMVARPRKDLALSANLPYQRHVDHNVVALDTGSYMAVIQLEGVSYETCDNAQLNTLHEQLAHRWKDLSRSSAAGGVAIWTHLCRRRQSARTEGEFTSDFARELDRKYQGQFDGVDAYSNEIFVTVVYKPGTDAPQQLSALLKQIRRARKGAAEVDEDAVKACREFTHDLVTALGQFTPRLLGLYCRDGLVFSEVLEYLNRLLTGVKRPMGLVDGRLGAAIATDRPIFAAEAIEIRGPGEERFAGILGVNEYPTVTRPGMLNELLTASFEFILAQSFRFIDRSSAGDILARKQNRMVAAEDKAASQTAALIEAQDHLLSGKFGMGEHNLSLIVYAPTIKQLSQAMSEARSCLAQAAIVVAREDLGLESAFWAMFPGNFKFRCRPAPVTTRNFAAMSCFHVHPTGKPDGHHWGPAIMALKSQARSPSFLSLHRGQLGNTFLCGPSGSGKTVLQGMLLSQLEKFDAQRVVFDKDRGCEILVRACGGIYLALENGIPTGCAPFKSLEFTPANFQFLNQLVAQLVAHPTTPLTAADEAKIAVAISALERVDPHRRSIKALLPLLDVTRPDSLGARLAKWARGGQLGWVLDNELDEIALDNRFLGFDMTDFLDNPQVRTPLMLYLFHRVEQLIDGRRIVIDIDEFWKALQDEAFQDLAKNKLKTIRKQNGLMIFGTQSPSDALRSDISRTIIEQCLTKIYLPNPGADMTDYCDGMGLTRKEFRLLKDELPGTRYFLIKQENTSLVVELDLAGYSDELAVLSGTTALVDVCAKAREQVGDDPAQWLPLFHRLRKEKVA